MDSSTALGFALPIGLGLAAIGFMISIDLKLTLISLIPAPIVVLLTRSLTQRMSQVPWARPAGATPLTMPSPSTVSPSGSPATSKRSGRSPLTASGWISSVPGRTPKRRAPCSCGGPANGSNEAMSGVDIAPTIPRPPSADTHSLMDAAR